MKADSPTSEIEELDLAIPNISDPQDEARVAALFEGLPGVVFARVTERGAFLRYRPASIRAEEICAAAQSAGFRASIFQDSASGRTGKSSN